MIVSVPQLTIANASGLKCTVNPILYSIVCALAILLTTLLLSVDESQKKQLCNLDGIF